MAVDYLRGSDSFGWMWSACLSNAAVWIGDTKDFFHTYIRISA